MKYFWVDFTSTILLKLFITSHCQAHFSTLSQPFISISFSQDLYLIDYLFMSLSLYPWLPQLPFFTKLPFFSHTHTHAITHNLSAIYQYLSRTDEPSFLYISCWTSDNCRSDIYNRKTGRPSFWVPIFFGHRSSLFQDLGKIFGVTTSNSSDAKRRKQAFQNSSGRQFFKSLLTPRRTRRNFSLPNSSWRIFASRLARSWWHRKY